MDADPFHYGALSMSADQGPSTGMTYEQLARRQAYESACRVRDRLDMESRQTRTIVLAHLVQDSKGFAAGRRQAVRQHLVLSVLSVTSGNADATVWQIMEALDRSPRDLIDAIAANPGRKHEDLKEVVRVLSGLKGREGAAILRTAPNPQGGSATIPAGTPHDACCQVTLQSDARPDHWIGGVLVRNKQVDQYGKKYPGTVCNSMRTALTLSPSGGLVLAISTTEPSEIFSDLQLDPGRAFSLLDLSEDPLPPYCDMALVEGTRWERLLTVEPVDELPPPPSSKIEFFGYVLPKPQISD